MMSNPGVAAKMFESLYNEGVNINMIATSEIRVTVLINEKDGVRAMNEMCIRDRKYSQLYTSSGPRPLQR